MKKIIVQLILVITFTLSAQALLAQGAPPPPPGGHGSSQNQPANGGGAPIGGGLGILLALGAAYGGRKIYQAWNQHKLEE